MTVDWAEANRAFFESGVWRSLFYDGRRVCKYPTDLWVYEEVIRATNPGVIIETGTYEGGSAAWFSRFAEVITIDHDPSLPGVPDRVFGLVGDTTEPETAELVALFLNDRPPRRCMVSLDAGHSAEHVGRELELYAPFVTPGCYLVVEDTAVDAYGLEADLYPDGGPGVAVERFLRDHPEFVPDVNCERFLLGMNPGGWLKRVA